MKKLDVIYVPPFGDHHRIGQKTIIKLWRLFGVEPHYFPVIWNDRESYSSKLTRAVKLLDTLSAKGNMVGIVGASAGASLAMNLYSERSHKIQSVVFISGKLVYPETVNENFFKTYPAFRQSVFDADTNFKKLGKEDRAKMITMYAIADETVPIRASKLPSVRHRRILMLGHIPAIYTALIFYSYPINKFLKRAKI